MAHPESKRHPRAAAASPIPHSKDVRKLCAVFALAATGCVSLWQALTVHYSYGGNWTALFCTGSLFKPPPAALRFENIYLFQNSYGYDGQMYHYIAHDPFFVRGFSANVDDPRFRYRRILVPVLAYFLAFGNDRVIDAAYIFVVAGFVLLGAYWLGRFAASCGYPAWYGLVFAMAPAVLVSMDRMTVDGALAACCAGFALYVRERSSWKLYAVLMAAALTRETGLLLPAASFLYSAGTRRFRQAIVFATAACPAVGWYVFVQFHTTPDSVGLFSFVPLEGIVDRVIHPVVYALPELIANVARSLDLLALGGIAMALTWAVSRALQRAWTPSSIAIYLFAFFILITF